MISQKTKNSVSLGKKRKGYIFTVDAVVALTFVLIVTFSVLILQLESLVPERRYERLNFIAEDAMHVLTNLRVGEVQDTATINQQISVGNITLQDYNRTVLDLIGSYWISGSHDISQSIAKEIIEPIEDEGCLGLFLEDNEIYSSCVLGNKDVAISSSLESGFEVGKPVSGFISRAFATKIKKNNTLIVKGDVIRSSVKRPTGGNNQNIVNITYQMTVPPNSQLNDSYWFIEAAWVDVKFRAFINGVHIPGSDASGSKLLRGLNSYLKQGVNYLTVEYRFGAGGEEGGDDGATHFVLTYSTDEVNTLPPTRFYLGEVRSNTSISYKKPIFVAGNVKEMSANISLKATNATLGFILESNNFTISKKTVTNGNAFWSDSEIKNALQANGINYQDLGARYFWFTLEADDYSSLENFGAGRIIRDTSYIDVDADFSINIYGFIDLTKVVPINSYAENDIGNFYRRLVYKFTSTGIPLQLDSQLAWKRWTGTNPQQNITANTVSLYQHPPQPLIPELARYGYNDSGPEIEDGENIYMLNFTNGYSVNPFNSLVSYTRLFPALVGYGDVFEIKGEAESDAFQRLQEKMGNDVSSTGINIETKSVQGIRYLWGPARFKILVWEN